MASSSHETTIRYLQRSSIVLGAIIIGLGVFVFKPYINAVPEAEKPPLNVPAVDYSPFRTWAVQADGRTKPFETASREMLRSITGRSKFEKQDSVSIVLMWMMTNGLPHNGAFPDWEAYPFILADHHDLRKWIYADKVRKAGEPKLSESDFNDELFAKLDGVLSEEELHGKYVAPKDLRDSTGFKLLLKQAAEIRREDPDKAMHQMSPEQTKAQEVNNRLGIYDKISQTPIVGSQDWNEMWLNDPLGVVQLDQVLGSEWFPIGRLKLTMGDIERHWRITLGNRMMQHPKKYIDATKQSELARFQGMIKANKALDAVDEAVTLRQKENHGKPLDQAEVEQLRKQVKQAQNESYTPDDPKYLMLHLNYMELRYPAIYFDALSRQPFPDVQARSVLNAYAKMQGAYLAQAGVKQGSPELAAVVGPVGLPGILTFPSFDEAAKEFFTTLKRVSDEIVAEGTAALPTPALQPAIVAYNKAIADAKNDTERDAARESLFVAAKNLGEDPHQYPGVSTIDLEITFHKVTPFMWAWVLMVPAVAAFLFSVITGFRSLYIAGFAFYALSLAFQVFGFYCRIAISGRPPVSNMYETIIFVAFMSCVFAMILSLFWTVV